MADTIPSNTSSSTTLSANSSSTSAIDYAGDKDWWRVSLQAGYGYQIAIEGSQYGYGTLGDPYLAIYNSAGVAQLSNNDYSLYTRDSYLYVTPTSSGTYFLSAEEYGNNATGTYTISLYRDQLATTATAATISVNSSTTDSIGVQSDYSDWYAVTLTAGVNYQFDLTGVWGDGGSAGLTLVDPWLSLRSNTGILVAYDDDSGLGLNSRIFYTPTTSGTYYLDVQEAGNDGAGIYRLTVKANPVTAALTLGSSQSGTLNFSSDVDLYSISLTAGTTYAFTIDGSTLTDPYLELLNSDGATLDFDDDNGSGLNAYLAFTPSSSGTYYLAARESGNNATGSYSVRAWQLPTVSIDSSAATEGDSGTTNLVFTLSLSAASPTAVSVTASTLGLSTATAGTDFNSTTSTVTFAPGQTSATFTVQVKGDTVFEPTENVYGFLYSPQGAVLDASSWAAFGIIADNDSPYALPSDDGLTYQWYLYPTTGINAFPVWSDYTGAGVRVAVFDQGIDPNHPDLNGNLLTNLGRNASNLSAGGAPILTDDNHGTAVAGTIAAERDGAGIVGVAYEASLVSIYNGMTSSEIPNAFQYAKNFDVLNNSWGFAQQDYTYSWEHWAFLDNFQSPEFSSAGEALANLAATGRDGLGTIVVQSAGNSFDFGDDTNLHNFQNSQYIITVAATDYAGNVTSYSSPGASVLVAAPGGGGSDSLSDIITTDRVGSAGDDSSNYASTLGTSFSAPIVSGIVALMLEANPELGYRDVQEILAYSAREIGSPSNDWRYNGAGNWNGGGLHYDAVYHDLGFGLVDARAAVRLAETWGASHTAPNRQQVTSSHSPALAIPDNNSNGAYDSIYVGQSIDVERVEVTLNVTHNFVGDLAIYLESPSGTGSWLLWRPQQNPLSAYGTDQNDIHFTFDTVLNWGESSTGTWNIWVSDRVAGDVGTFDSWTLNLIGKPASSDDCYIYTDEFAEACSDQANRATLSDSSGIDTLNAAACSTNSILNLVSGSTCTIDGRSLTISSSTIIENAYGGDGADQISGNSAANSLNGMRGNDTISGLAGNDTLDGGAGNDRLIGNEGADSLTGGIGDDVFAYQASNESTVSGLDTITDFSSGDRIEFSGISGVSLAQTLYSYQVTINATLSAITANSSINNVAVQFTDGVDGYLYIKGSGTGTSFNGSLIKLAGRTSALGLGDFIGITTTTNFDTSAPTVSSFSPADEATAVAIGSNIVVTFSEAIQRGSGNIVLKTSAGATIATYDATTSSNLSISGSTITVNPTNNLSHNTGYRLEFSAGNIKDLAGNSYAGTSSYNFTTQGEMTSGSSGNDNLQASNGNASYDGGAGEDLITFQGMRSQYSISLQANGDVVATNSSGTIVLRDIENIHFSDSAADVSIMSLLPSPRIDTSDAQSYNAKVQTYFIGTLGRAATTAELSQYTSLLASQNGSVWLDANGQTGTTGSLVAYLATSSEFASLTAGKSNSQIVDEMYLRLTGDLPSLALHDYYQSKLDASTIRVRGLLNAILNDLSIMPRADGTLNQPSTWTVNIQSDMEPVELVGMVNKLHSIGNISFTNLDASGNLS
ncbi:S8 family serine peptidase [Denitratisoma oestradiolicum]|uniref:P/Homo B domain-containing protein n=1 Tax=Denitratisoma oestradiolicum TaxID=311182 RepID=A0A6S6XY62_9PROT|nr:S8 family serine peptidase [Denitratisoma oestradiolicum]CAB1367792.1 conserved protein of unknown function [Denitratisoma oestradiolicum]